MRLTPVTKSINSAKTTQERNADYSTHTSLKPSIVMRLNDHALLNVVSWMN